ncbi:MAG: class I SAM-dependent methyltransferase [Rhizobiaceae bacterium]
MNMAANIELQQPQSEYVLDAPYTWSYFEYQNPLLMSFIARLNGFQMPSINQPFTYCDLGCGNGVSVNLLASSFPQGHFYGVDFNAEHIENAQRIADKSGLTNVTFIDASFEDYERSNPPKFDYIAMHGIYSWVSEEIREQCRRLVDLTLKPGGLAYLCYNTQPGWAELIPLWKMMQAYSAHLPVDSLTKARIGLENLALLRDQGAQYFKETPSASRYLDRLLERNPHYVAHEFCNGVFEPQYFSDVANAFGEFGLDYAGTMKMHRNNLNNTVSSRFREHLAAATNPIDHESRVSFIRNEFFRRDLYIRDGVRSEDPNDLLDDIRIGANVVAGKLDNKLDLGRREVDLQHSFWPVVQELAASGQHTIADIVRHPQLKEHNSEAIRNAVIDLLGGYQIQPIAEACTPAEVELTTKLELTTTINRVLMEERLNAEGKTYVESATMGGAMRLNFINGLLVMALDGTSFKEAIANVKATVAEFDASLLEKLEKSDDEPTHQWIDRKARQFWKYKLPVLIRYGIVAKA